MNVRRNVLGLVVLVGGLILILGLFGVFSPSSENSTLPPELTNDETPVPIAPPSDVEEEDDDTGGLPDVTIKGSSFRIDGKDWVLTAPEATFETRRGARLVKPKLEYTYRTKDRVGKVLVTAGVGLYEGNIEGGTVRGVSMSDGVRIEYIGDTPAVLTTESVSIDLTTQMVTTDDPIEFTAESKEGRQQMTGTGATLDLSKRSVRIEKDISMDIVGVMSLFNVSEEKGEEPDAPATEEPPVMHVECAGPVVGDGFRHTVTLNGGVSVVQGENTLTADTVQILFGDKADEPQRLTATGHVHLKAAGAEAECDQLVRSTIDDQIVLTGNPAVASYEGSSISAAKIAIEVTDDRVIVPGPGKLNLILAATETEPAKEVTVGWTSSLRFDRKVGKAVIRGDVIFDGAGLNVFCQTLTVQLDETGKEMLEARAEEKVRVVADLKSLLSSDDPNREKLEGTAKANAHELTWRAEGQELVLIGEASLDYGGHQLSGERVELSQSDSTIKVPGPGSFHAVQGEGEEAKLITVTWKGKGGVNFAQTDREVVFEEGVVLEYEGRSLQADKMTAKLGEGNTLSSFTAEGNVHGEEADGVTFSAKTVNAVLGEGNAIESLVAEGDVKIEKTEEWHATAKKMTAGIGPENAFESVLAEGDVSVEMADGRTMKADSVDAKLADGERLETLDATGSVELLEKATEENPGRSLKADTLELVMGETNEEIKTFKATGNVTLEQDDMQVTGDELTWNGTDELGVMTGTSVIFERGSDRLVGDCVEFSQKEDWVRMTGRERVRADIFTESGSIQKFLPKK